MTFTKMCKFEVLFKKDCGKYISVARVIETVLQAMNFNFFYIKNRSWTSNLIFYTKNNVLLRFILWNVLPLILKQSRIFEFNYYELLLKYKTYILKRTSDIWATVNTYISHNIVFF